MRTNVMKEVYVVRIAATSLQIFKIGKG